MNLVVGSTGILGSEICRALATAGKPVRALVRPTAEGYKVDALRSIGAEIVNGDVQDRASLDTACRGATAVFTTLSTTYSRQPGDSIQASDLEGQQALVDAAKGADVQNFVYVSMTENAPEDMPFVKVRRSVEEYVRHSGIPYTILRPSSFMETYLNPLVGFDVASGRVSVFGSGEGKINWISAGDIAEFAVQSLDNPTARNATLELGGPDHVSPMDVVRMAEEMRGGTIEVFHVTEDMLQAQIAGANDDYGVVFPQFALGMIIPGERKTDMRALLRAFPSIELTGVEDYVRQFIPE